MDSSTSKFSDFFIRNCVFKYECDKNWEELENISSDKNIKFCSNCNRDVYMVNDSFELTILIKENKCVAIPRIEVIKAKALKNINKQNLGQISLKKDL
jgi:hypothetical protein